MASGPGNKSATGMTQQVGDLMRTLMGGVSGLIPEAVRRAWDEDLMSVVVDVDASTKLAYLGSGSNRKVADARRLGWVRFRWPSLISATVRVPLGSCLVREFKLPRAALARASDVLAHDLETTTPLKVADVHWDWYLLREEAEGQTVILRQVLVKREFVAGALAALAAARLPVKAIEVAAPDGMRMPVNLFQRDERRDAPATVWLRVALAACVLSVVVAGAALAYLKITNLTGLVASADARVEKLTLEAQQVRKALADATTASEQMRQARLRKIDTPLTLSVWEEVTHVLPEGTWLTELRVEEGRVQIDGLSVNASELVSLLAKVAIFNNVAFASPVTRDPQREQERFQIKFNVGRGEGSPATQAKRTN